MDSLNVISDINKHITELSNKIETTSKASSVAFSYLYSKIEDLSKLNRDIDNLDIKVSYFHSVLGEEKRNISSYISGLHNNIIKLEEDNSNYCITVNGTIDIITNSINSVKDEFNEEFKNIKKDIELINKRLDSIINVPQNYIVVKKSTKLYEFFKLIGDFFYKVFHYKKIQEERRI